MKRIVVGLLAVCLLGSLTVLAEEKATTEKAAKKEVDITATGKLAKNPTGFTVTEADGTVVKVMLQKAAKEGEAAVVSNEEIVKLVGKDVKMVGMGKAGKKTKTIKTVTSIEEAAAPAAPAPEAAAPAAEAPAAK